MPSIPTSSDLDLKTAKEWVTNNKDVFEKMVVAAAYASPKHLRIFEPHLCQDKNRKGVPVWVDDFSRPPLFALYRAIAEHARLIRKSDIADRRISPAQMHSFITAYANMAECISLPEVDQAMTCMSDEVAPLATPQNFAFMDSIYPYWLHQQKRTRLIVKDMQGRHDDDENIELDEKLRDVRRSLMATRTFSMHRFAEDIGKDEVMTPRIPTGFHSVDAAFGGGVGLQESSLIMACPSAGKTVLATQFAGSFAMSGVKTLFVSTEQDHRRLQPRFISAICGVPFDKIKDKVSEMAMTPEQITHFRKCAARLDENLIMVNWQDNSDDFAGAIEALFDQAVLEFGGQPPMIMMLDWLGGAFGKRVAHDPGLYRRALRGGADAMSDVAKKFKMHTITCAQLATVQCKNKMNVDSTMLSECKTLHEPMTNALGVTFIEDAEARDSAEDKAQMSLNQYFCISKSRQGTDRKIPVSRQFRYQRFAYRELRSG